jgi:hypothetical protein
MEYSVVAEDKLGELIQKVNQAIQNGWRPLGGVTVEVLEVSRKAVYLQAIVKVDQQA